MVATISRRVILRPELDEPCPDWARPLLPLSCEVDTQALGIANERVPQETALVLHDLFPVPPKPVRERKREMTERRYKPYVKAWAAAVYFALLPYALAKQVSLFSGPGGETTADVAVLCFRRLAELAPRLGISYDRLQKWMTVLLVLGFVKRFRAARQVLYILPLTAYVPSPSPEAVLKKLNALIESQFVEETLPDGRTVWCDRCPEWTAQLTEIRTRFVLRYQLPPTVSEEQLQLPPGGVGQRSSDQAFQAMLHEVSEAIPEAVRPAMMTRLLPILARSYAQVIGSTSGRRPPSGPQAGTAVLSGEMTDPSSFSPNLDIATARLGKAGGETCTASRLGAPHPGTAGAAGDGQSRFDAARAGQENDRNRLRSKTDVPAHKPANVDSLADEFLTLQCNITLTTFLEKEGTVNVRDTEGQKGENRKKAELLADLLRVPGNVNFYTRLFNQVSRGELGEDLIKAVFIYTLYQGRAGDITSQEPDALGKYFYGVFKRWGVLRTYAAACQAYRKKWQSKTPQGIRPRDKAAIDPFMPFGYEQIADMIRRGERGEEAGWLPFPPGSPPEVPVQPLGEQEAEALAQSMREQASWYLWDPTSGPVSSGETVFFVVNAWQDGGEQDGQRWTFTSWGQWLDYHERMLTPPLYLDPALRRGRGSAQDAGEKLETDDQGAREIACARAACALFAYLNERPVGHMGDLDWVSLVLSLSFEELAVLGEPIRFPRSPPLAGEPSRGPVAGEGLNVELEEGVVLTYEQFQVLLADGGYRGACVELEDGGSIPRERFEELLAAGEYVELDDGTPLRADSYAMLLERAQSELAREGAGKRHAEASREELVAQPGLAAASLQDEQTASQLGDPLPGWWKELCLDGGDGARFNAEAARQGLLLLQSALDPRLYRLQARPNRTEDALCFALELSSICSGWILTFEEPAQVERILDMLREQGGGEEGGQQRPLRRTCSPGQDIRQISATTV